MLAVVALLPLALFDVLSGLPASALAYQRLRGSAVRIAGGGGGADPGGAPALARRCSRGLHRPDAVRCHGALDGSGRGDRGHRPRRLAGPARGGGRPERFREVDSRQRADGLPAVQRVGPVLRSGGGRRRRRRPAPARRHADAAGAHLRHHDRGQRPHRQPRRDGRRGHGGARRGTAQPSGSRACPRERPPRSGPSA